MAPQLLGEQVLRRDLLPEGSAIRQQQPRQSHEPLLAPHPPCRLPRRHWARGTPPSSSHRLELERELESEVEHEMKSDIQLGIETEIRHRHWATGIRFCPSPMFLTRISARRCRMLCCCCFYSCCYCC